MFEAINRIKRSELSDDVQKDLLSADDHQKLNSLVIDPDGGGSTLSHHLDITVNATDFKYDGSKDVSILIDTMTLGAATADHEHPPQVNITGNAATANRFFAPVNIGNVSFDGSKSITLTDIGAASSSHTHDDKYAVKDHDHNDTYSLKTHNHDGVYSPADHNHDDDYAVKDHTHNYAGSASVGGAATSALKLNSKVKISLTGDAEGEIEFDGSEAVSIPTKVVNGGSITSYPASRFYTTEPLRSDTHRVKMTTVTGAPYSILFYNSASSEGLEPIKRYDNIPSGVEYELTDLPVNETWPLMYVIGDFLYMKYSMYPESKTVDDVKHVDAFCVTDIILGDMPFLYEVSSYEVGSHRQTRYLKTFKLGRNNITDMSEYFFGCVSIDYNSIRDLDTSEVTNMDRMFKFTRIKTFPPLNTSKVASMDGMFESSMIIVTPEMDTSNVTSANKLFYCCYDLVTVSEYDFGNLESCSSMFSYSGIRSINIVLPKATNLITMFKNCSKLKSVSVIAESEMLEDCSSMFSNCISLENDIHIHTPFAKKYTNLFEGCVSIVEISWFDSRNATDMYGLCLNCLMLKYFPLIETTNVKNFQRAFEGCSRLEYFPPLDTSNCSNFDSMFQNCYNLIEIPKLDLSSAENISFMFSAHNSSLKLKCHGEVILTNPLLNKYNAFIATNAEKGVRIGYLPECRAIAEDIVKTLNYDNDAAYPHIVSYNVDQAIRVTLPDIEKDETNPRVLLVELAVAQFVPGVYEVEGFNKYQKKVMGFSTDNAQEYVEIFNNQIAQDGGDTTVKHLVIRTLSKDVLVLGIYTAPDIILEEVDVYNIDFTNLGEEYVFRGESYIGTGFINEGEPFSRTAVGFAGGNVSKVNIHFTNSLFCGPTINSLCGVFGYDNWSYSGEIGYLNILHRYDLSRLFYNSNVEVIPNLSFYHCTTGNELFSSSNCCAGLPKDFHHMTRNMVEMNEMFSNCSIREVEIDLENCKSINKIFGFTSESDTNYTGIEKAVLHNMRYINVIHYDILQANYLQELSIDGLSGMSSLNYAFTKLPKLKKLSLMGLTDNLTDISAMCNDLIYLEEVYMPGFSGKSLRNASNAFRECFSLKSIPQLDTSRCGDLTAYISSTLITDISLDLSNCTCASHIFHRATNLRSVKLTNTSHVEIWSYAFSETGITEIPELDLSSLVIADGMFYGCANLKDEQELILNTKNFKLMPTLGICNIFEGCGAVNGRSKNFIIRYPALDLSKNTPVINYKYISKFIEFGYANPSYNVFFIPYGSLVHVAWGKCGSEDGSTWIPDDVTNFNLMHDSSNTNNTNFEIYEFDKSMQFRAKRTTLYAYDNKFDTSDGIGGVVMVIRDNNGIRLGKISAQTIGVLPKSLNIDGGNLSFSYGIHMAYGGGGIHTIEGKKVFITYAGKSSMGLFYFTKDKQVYINSKKIDYYSSLFNYCSELRNVIIHTDEFESESARFTNKKVNLYDAFSGCNKLMYVPDHIVKISRYVTIMTNTFRECSSLKTIPMMDTSNVTEFNGCLMQCTSIEEAPNWDLSKATTTEGMFYGCANLLRIPRYHLSSCLKTRQMFYGCYHLYDVPVWWDMPVVTNTEYMFSSCFCLEHPIAYASLNVTNANEMYSLCSRLHGLVNFDSLGTFKDMFKDTTLPIVISIQNTNPQAGSTVVPANVTKNLINFRG